MCDTSVGLNGTRCISGDPQPSPTINSVSMGLDRRKGNNVLFCSLSVLMSTPLMLCSSHVRPPYCVPKRGTREAGCHGVGTPLAHIASVPACVSFNPNSMTKGDAAVVIAGPQRLGMPDCDDGPKATVHYCRRGAASWAACEARNETTMPSLKKNS